MTAITDCKHFVNGERVWCPPVCPCQSCPRPSSARGRRRLIRQWKRDGSYRAASSIIAMTGRVGAARDGVD